MGRKKGGDNGQAAIQAAQDRATNALIEGRNQGYQFLDTAQQQGLEGYEQLLPMSRKISQGAFDKVANFEENAKLAGQQANEAYYKPAQRQVEEVLKNLFRSGGVGGSNNSRGQNFMARQAEEMAFNEGQRQYDINQQARNNLLNENQNLYNFGNQPEQYRSQTILDTGKAKANTAIGTGTQLSNVYTGSGQNLATIQSQEAARRNSSKGGLLGAGAGIVGNTVSMFGGR